jgi:hypothetical protein
MPRSHWPDLPQSLRRAVEGHAGPVLGAKSAGAGSACDLAATLYGDNGLVFCKGMRAGNPLLPWLRNEVRVNPALPPELVPRVRWTVEQDGWLLVGYEHVTGRHPDLSPGSPDLPAVAQTLAALTEVLTPCPAVQIQPAAVRWAGLTDPRLVGGDTLLHTDVTSTNFLLADGGVRVVDWSAPVQGAAWIDAAMMVLRLIADGHTPASAETWATQVPAWTTEPEPAITAFAGMLAGLWAERQSTSPAPHRAALAEAARRWSAYRRHELATA